MQATVWKQPERHADMLWTGNTLGSPMAISAAQVIAAYSSTTGYDPATGANDNGTSVPTFLGAWKCPGFWNTQIDSFCAIDPSNRDHFKRAIHDLGCVVLGFRLPESAEHQFAAGEPWTPKWLSPIVGGHCVIAVCYGADGFKVVTWAKLQPVSWSFLDQYCDEAYACVSPLFLTEGATPKD